MGEFSQAWRAQLRGRRVAVTGGGGFLGAEVVAELLAAQAQVLVVDVAGGPEVSAPHRVVRCDVRSPRVQDELTAFAPEVIVHLAAQVGVPSAVADPAGDADVNVGGTIQVCEAAVRSRAQLVFTSSAAVYGVAPALPAGEDEPLAPASPYGLSKATAMSYVDYYMVQRGVAATTLVLANVYGPSSASAVSAFVRAAVHGEPAVVRGQGMCRDWVHVSDVAEALLRSCVAAPAGRVNVGTGQPVTVERVHALVAAVTGSAVPPRREPAMPGEAQAVALARQRAAARLGWAPRWDLAEGIAHLVHAEAGEVAA